MSIFTKGSQWEASRIVDLENSRKLAWRLVAGLGLSVLVMAISLALLGPTRRTIPYLVKQDSATGNVEVLQSFDNRVVGSQVLLDKYWARAYVLAREQYNWWFLANDYDLVNRLSEPSAFAEFGAQFEGEKRLDKVFADTVERRVKILSVAPSAVIPDQMVVRFERTTISRGQVVEAPTVFVVSLSFRYVPKSFGAEADLIRNPTGYQVFAYRRVVEVAATTPVAAAAVIEGVPQ